MKKERYEEGRFTEQGRGLGTVTEEMITKRARELALINGRSEHNLLDSDLEQARRELQGDERLDPRTTAAEAITEDKRWETVPDNEGKQAQTVPPSDEQTFAEKLVQEGVRDAEHERKVEATRESLKRDTQS